MLFEIYPYAAIIGEILNIYLYIVIVKYLSVFNSPIFTICKVSLSLQPIRGVGTLSAQLTLHGVIKDVRTEGMKGVRPNADKNGQVSAGGSSGPVDFFACRSKLIA